MGSGSALQQEQWSGEAVLNVWGTVQRRGFRTGFEPVEERRFGHRCSFDGTVYFARWSRDHRPAHAGKGKILDLSGGGARIRTDLAVPVDAQLDIIVTVEETLFRAKGRVVHQGRTRDGHYQVRACFERVDPVGKRFLLDLV